MNAYELNRRQMNELKREYFCAVMRDGRYISPLLDGITKASEIPDEDIYTIYATCEFEDKDFCCSGITVAETLLQDAFSDVLTEEDVKHLARFGRADHVAVVGETPDDNDPDMCSYTLYLLINYLTDGWHIGLTEDETKDIVCHMLGRYVNDSEYYRLCDFVRANESELMQAHYVEVTA